MEKELKVIEYNDKRILTTKQLAEVYETEENNINVNFYNNKDRFVEGNHYYKLEGNELKKFKDLINDINIVDKRAPSLILWTERGEKIKLILKIQKKLNHCIMKINLQIY